MKNKGFTLVELLAVIVILAIIMIIAIPSVLSTMETARKKSLVEYADKAILKAEEKYTTRSLEGLPVRGVIVYDIVNDLDFTNTGDYKGYVLIDATVSNDRVFYVYLYDSSYLINLKKNTDISTESLVDVSSVELITSVEKIVEEAGYNSYYSGSVPTLNEAVNGKYEFLDSLVLNGDKYINTSVIPTDSTKVEIDLISNDWKAILGSRTKVSSNDSFVLFGSFYTNAYSSYTVYSTNLTDKFGGYYYTSNEPLKVVFDLLTLKINDKIASTFSPTISLNGKYPLFLFTVNSGGVPDYRLFNGTFYSCKIYDGSTLVRNYVPAKIKSTGETIIYDKVEKKEYQFIIYK